MTASRSPIPHAPPALAKHRPILGMGLALMSGAVVAQATMPQTTLPAVIVVGDTLGDLPPVHPGRQVARGGSLGVLGTSDVMDVPFNTMNYTADLIEDQQARTAADTLINDASVNLTTAR